jgi:Coenzyme PQQ synthesis protein D (PqqD)
MSDQRIVINSPNVVGEIIDGEAIVMCLETGHYYSSEGTGGIIWSWILEGRSRNQIMDLALARYDGPAEDIRRNIEAFLDELLGEKLVRCIPAEEAGTASTGTPGNHPREPFGAPTLCTHTDMKDLIVLDPIHDVDQAGWPTPKTGIES